MSYNQEFFDEYKNYLQEPTVRNVHDLMLQTFSDSFPKWKYPFNIIDFGCGQCCEYLNYGQFSGYAGLDLNPPLHPGCFKADYTRMHGEDMKWFAPYAFHGFVSLFSTECCLTRIGKYEFYRKVFRETDVQMGLVAGFYYKSRIQQEKVEETGGIVSFQSTEDQRDFMCPEFIEYRTYIDVPSKMFGPDVVEVWKLLIKKPNHGN